MTHGGKGLRGVGEEEERGPAKLPDGPQRNGHINVPRALRRAGHIDAMYLGAPYAAPSGMGILAMLDNEGDIAHSATRDEMSNCRTGGGWQAQSLDFPPAGAARISGGKDRGRSDEQISCETTTNRLRQRSRL